jgi:hypothetical protein
MNKFTYRRMLDWMHKKLGSKYRLTLIYSSRTTVYDAGFYFTTRKRRKTILYVRDLRWFDSLKIGETKRGATGWILIARAFELLETKFEVTLPPDSELPNVQAQRWTWLARDVRLGAQTVTDMAIRCSAWIGGFVFQSVCKGLGVLAGFLVGEKIFHYFH